MMRSPPSVRELISARTTTTAVIDLTSPLRSLEWLSSQTPKLPLPRSQPPSRFSQAVLAAPGELIAPRRNSLPAYQINKSPNGAKRLSEKKIQAGMPVDVIIKTGERTFASYLIKPISDRFAKAFKED